MLIGEDYYGDACPQGPGLARRAAEAHPGHRSMWRGLRFAVPFKSMNYTQLAQRAVDPYRLQNVARAAGTFGSAMDRTGSNNQGFAHYRGGNRSNGQFTLIHKDNWTIAWAQHPTSLDGGGHPTGVVNWTWLSSLADDYSQPLSSWYVMQPWYTWSLRLSMYAYNTSTGTGVWEHLTWPMGIYYWFAALISPHTWLLRKYPGQKTVELSIDGRIIGTRSYTHELVHPGFGNNLGMSIGTLTPRPVWIGPSVKGRWDAVCTWERCLDSSEVQKWHGNPLAMFTPARRRVPTPPLEEALPEPGLPCDWFDPRSGLPWTDEDAGQGWLDDQAASGWYDEAAAQSWLQAAAGQSWLQSSPGQDWLQAAAGQSWLQTAGGLAWLQTAAGQAWSAAVGGGDWYDDKASADWYDRRRCS